MEGFNTTGVRGQIIGQHGLTAAEQRGIMTLEGTEILDLVAQMRAVWQPGVENKQGNYTTKPEWPSAPSSPWIFRSIFPLQQSRSSCPLCFTSLDNKPTNILQGSIFSDVLTETGSPARALQAHLTIVVGMAYYTFLPLFDTSSNASMTVFVSRLMPVSASGYWSVMGILGMHVLICSVLGTLYVLMAEHSLLGNAWAAVAQVANTELAQIIMREGTLSTDSEIAKELRRTGELGTRYQLVRTWDGDGAVLVPISDDLKLPSRLAPYLRAKGQRKKLQRHSKQVSEYELSKGYFGHEEVKEVCSSRSSGISSGIDGEH
jgi:hypothetical protein